MNTHIIEISIEQQPELYRTLLSATLNHSAHNGCYVMQYSEHVDGDGRKLARFMLREGAAQAPDTFFVFRRDTPP